MDEQVFKTALKEAETELDRLLNEQAKIEQRRAQVEMDIAKLTEKIGHLAALSEGSDLKARLARNMSQSGLTSAILQVLKAEDVVALTVTMIRNRLQQNGFEVDKYQNILATLHITLNRLTKTGQVKVLRDRKGKKAYKWNPEYTPFRIDPVRLKQAIAATKKKKD